MLTARCAVLQRAVLHWGTRVKAAPWEPTVLCLQEARPLGVGGEVLMLTDSGMLRPGERGGLGG